MLFALHDLLKDSPFSKLDLVTCRNLFIYLNARGPERGCSSIFHFSPWRILKACSFLGTSESVDEGTNGLFAPLIDKKRRIYVTRRACRSAQPAGCPCSSEPSTLSQMVSRTTAGAFHARLQSVETRCYPTPRNRVWPWPRPCLPRKRPSGDPTGAADSVWQPGDLRFHASDLAQAGPSMLIVNPPSTRSSHLSEHGGGSFLQVGGGEIRRMNLLAGWSIRCPSDRAARGALPAPRSRPDRRSKSRGMPGRVRPRQTKTVDDPGQRPARGLAPGPVFWSVFREQEAEMGTSLIGRGARPSTTTEKHPVVRAPRSGKSSGCKARNCATCIEDSEASQVRSTKPATEELQAMNEELRSASEELETSSRGAPVH